jgi:hypothetical protein
MQMQTSNIQELHYIFELRTRNANLKETLQIRGAQMKKLKLNILFLFVAGTDNSSGWQIVCFGLVP